MKILITGGLGFIGSHICLELLKLDNEIIILDSLVNIKSKEELIGEVITLLQSPAKNLISALKSSGTKLSGVIKTLSEKDDK